MPISLLPFTEKLERIPIRFLFPVVHFSLILPPPLHWNCSCPGHQRPVSSVQGSPLVPLVLSLPMLDATDSSQYQEHSLLWVSRAAHVSGFHLTDGCFLVPVAGFPFSSFASRCWSVPALGLGSSLLFLCISFLQLISSFPLAWIPEF